MSDHEDLVRMILQKVPPKALVRFRSLSNLYDSIIGSRLFRKTYAEDSYKNPMLLMDFSHYMKKSFMPIVQILESELYGDENGGETIPIEVRFDTLNIPSLPNSVMNVISSGIGFNVMGVSNGLILLKFFPDDFVVGLNRYAPFVVLWNPSTHSTREILPIENSIFGYQHAMAIGFDWGLDEYKILQYSTTEHHQSCFVFSLKCMAWKEIDPLPYRIGGGPAIGCESHLHWLEEGSQSPKIVAFSLSDENFHQILVPDLGHASPVLQITSTDGSLALVDLGQQPLIRLWVLTEYGDPYSWSPIAVDISVLPGELFVPHFQMDYMIWMRSGSASGQHHHEADCFAFDSDTEYLEQDPFAVAVESDTDTHPDPESDSESEVEDEHYILYKLNSCNAKTRVHTTVKGRFISLNTFLLHQTLESTDPSDFGWSKFAALNIKNVGQILL